MGRSEIPWTQQRSVLHQRARFHRCDLDDRSDATNAQFVIISWAVWDRG